MAWANNLIVNFYWRAEIELLAMGENIWLNIIFTRIDWSYEVVSLL